MDLMIVGVSIGTAEAWDQVTDWGLVFYDFHPTVSDIPKGDLYVNFEDGKVTITSVPSDEEPDGVLLLETNVRDFIGKFP